MSPSSTATAPVGPISSKRSSVPPRDQPAPLPAPAPRRDDAGPASFEVRGLPGSFCMRYVPELDLRSGSIVSCEAVLRWQHPDFGLLRPGVTLDGSRWHHELPAIEEQAMAQVCCQIASWDSGLRVQVAVNVTTTHLLSARFSTSLDRALDASGIDPSQLAIDVPIEAVAAEPGLLRNITEDLAARGVGVVIDGVGRVPSPRVLRQINASAWKIDLRTAGGRWVDLHRSVRDALVEARAAGAVTTAKAVEDLDLLRAVRELGFDRAFGLAISPPIAPSAMRHVAGRGSICARPLFGPAAPVAFDAAGAPGTEAHRRGRPPAARGAAHVGPSSPTAARPALGSADRFQEPWWPVAGPSGPPGPSSRPRPVVTVP